MYKGYAQAATRDFPSVVPFVIEAPPKVDPEPGDLPEPLTGEIDNPKLPWESIDGYNRAINTFRPYLVYIKTDAFELKRKNEIYGGKYAIAYERVKGLIRETANLICAVYHGLRWPGPDRLETRVRVPVTGVISIEFPQSYQDNPKAYIVSYYAMQNSEVVNISTQGSGLNVDPRLLVTADKPVMTVSTSKMAEQDERGRYSKTPLKYPSSKSEQPKSGMPTVVKKDADITGIGDVDYRYGRGIDVKLDEDRFAARLELQKYVNQLAKVQTEEMEKRERLSNTTSSSTTKSSTKSSPSNSSVFVA
jgi:hypothetical protein